MKIVYLLLLISFAWKGWSPTEGGNGGDVIVCPENKAPILLDFYEHEFTGGKISLPEGKDEWEIARKILDRVARVNPTRARIYGEGLKNFPLEMKFEAERSLSDIPDQGDVPLPRACELKQVVIQQSSYDWKENYFSWDVIRKDRYIVDKNIWDLMDSKNRAGLIIHELILREVSNMLSHDDTKNVRKLNGLWSSPEISTISQLNYNKKLISFGFNHLDIFQGGFSFFTSFEKVDWSLGPIPNLTVNGDGIYTYIPLGFSYSYYRGRPLELMSAEFYQDGRIKEVMVLNSKGSKGFPVRNEIVPLVGKIRFEDDIVRGQLSEMTYLKMKGRLIPAKGEVILSRDGHFLGGMVMANLEFMFRNYILTTEAGTKIEVSEEGKLLFAESATGIAKGVGEDFFSFERSEVRFDVMLNEVRYIKDVKEGRVQSCRNEAVWEVSGRFSYGQTFAKPETIEKSSPISCRGADGRTYNVENEVLLNTIMYRSCEVLSARELPVLASPCEIL